MKKESEKLVERTLVKLIREAGGMCIKLQADYQGGIPDRLCLFPNGRVAFVETKTTGEKPRPLQLHYHEKLKSLGFRVEVIDTVEKAREFVGDFMQAGSMDDAARRVAVERNDVRVNTNNLFACSFYYQGALIMAMALRDRIAWDVRGDDKVYRDAELRLITKDKRSAELFLGGYEIGCKECQRNKKGNLVRCEAYFIQAGNTDDTMRKP